jgi:hypothetical protein
MKKYLILSALLLGLLGNVFAQDGGFAPAAGDFSGAVLFGRGSYQTYGLDIPSAAGTNTSWSVSGSAPYLNAVEPNYNDVSNMFAVEGRYFITNTIALKMSGGAIFRGTPSRPNIPGYTSYSVPNASWIPYYNAVVQSKSTDAVLNIGADYLFPSKKFDRLFPYLGANIPLGYGRRSQFDPTIADVNGLPMVVDISERHVEIIAFGLQAVAGFDFYLAEGLYTGFEFKPVSYVYSYSRKIPAAGLEVLEADTHTWSFMSQIYFKLGFRF